MLGVGVSYFWFHWNFRRNFLGSRFTLRI